MIFSLWLPIAFDGGAAHCRHNCAFQSAAALCAGAHCLARVYVHICTVCPCGSQPHPLARCRHARHSLLGHKHLPAGVGDPSPSTRVLSFQAASGLTRVTATPPAAALSSPHAVIFAAVHLRVNTALLPSPSPLIPRFFAVPRPPPRFPFPPPPHGIIGAAALGVMKRGTPPSAASSDDEGPRPAADGGRVAALNAALDGDVDGTATAAAETVAEGVEDDLSGVPAEVIAAAAEREGAARAALDAVLSVRDWGAETDVDTLRSAVRVLLGEVTGDRGAAVVGGLGGEAPMAVDDEGLANGHASGSNGHASSSTRGGTAGASPVAPAPVVGTPGEGSDDDEVMGLAGEPSPPTGAAAAGPGTSPAAFASRAKYIPMRLTADERATLRLVEAALSVSDYTSEVDILSYNKAAARKRMHTQLRILCAILTGLTVAADFKAGAELLESRDFAGNESWFRSCFEISRRHKVSNPQLMKVEYGKLMYCLMDAVSPPIARLLGMDVVAPIETVASFLAAHGASELLTDPLLPVATAEVVATGKSRPVIQREIRTKEAAVERLARRYASPARSLPADEVRRALYSLGDNNAYLRFSRDACDTMLGLLRHYFDGPGPAAKNELAILAGRGGARLSHGHTRQYAFVEQSLTLWREITHNMFGLWCMADMDLLDASNGYTLRNTGQGLHRVQQAPRVERAMANILRNVQAKTRSGWVGSSVVHIADANVPNGYTFLIKYTHVQELLMPVINVISGLSSLAQKDARVNNLIADAWEDVDGAKRAILRDFFRHAFDGSGADSFFSAGSSIDGRMTSAWNWCSKLESKSFYPLFLLSGFTSFDGKW